MEKKAAKKWILTAILVAAVIILIANAFKIVPTGYTGVRVRFGQVSSESIPSGIALKIPFIENIRLVNNKQQDVTIDGQIWSETSERTALYYEGINIGNGIFGAASKDGGRMDTFVGAGPMAGTELSTDSPLRTAAAVAGGMGVGGAGGGMGMGEAPSLTDRWQRAASIIASMRPKNTDGGLRNMLAIQTVME